MGGYMVPAMTHMVFMENSIYQSRLRLERDSPGAPNSAK